MAVVRIENLVKHLREVGMPIEIRAMNIEALKAEVKQLEDRIKAERRLLRKAVARLWTPVEIAMAEEAAK